MPVFGLLQLLQTSKTCPAQVCPRVRLKTRTDPKRPVCPINRSQRPIRRPHNGFRARSAAMGIRLVVGGGVPDDSQERDSRQWFCTAVNRGSTPRFCPRRG